MTSKNLVLSAITLYVLATAGSYVVASQWLGYSGLGSKALQNNEDNPQAQITPSEPATEECPINGAMYGKTARAAWEKRRPLGVVVENSPDSRPQSGLSSAQVVYEAVSEGGVTRFLGIYYCDGAKFVGPVRSARVHFINMLREWGNNPLYAHIGGANCNRETGSGCGNGAPADALGLLDDIEWRYYNDLDQFRVGYPTYWKDPERLPDVATEHQHYTSTDKLWTFAATKHPQRQPSALTSVDEDGLVWNSTWKPWKFQEDVITSKRGNTKYISYHFYDSNVNDYGVVWEYDNTTNEYKRFHGKKPHIDKNTNAQLAAKNVFVMLGDESPANDDYPGGHIVYSLLKGGDLYAFQNGDVIKGTWEKEDYEEKIKFLDEKGEEIPVVRGQVWVSLIPSENEVYSGQALPKKEVTSIPAKETNTLKPSLSEDE